MDVKKILRIKVIKSYLIGTFKNLLNSNQTRSEIAKKNIFVSIITKGISLVISFLIVPLTINYLDTYKYGIWLTITSVVGWFNLFDLGFGNGLRNKFAESLAQKDYDKAQKYVSTTYAVIILISLCMVLVFVFIYPFIDWYRLFNADIRLQDEIKVTLLIVYMFFCLRFIAQLITTIFAADQKQGLVDIINSLNSIITLISIYILVHFNTDGSLIYISLILVIIPVVTLLIVTFRMFSTKYAYVKPKLEKVEFKFIKDLASLGIKFFIISISGIVMFSTSNFIISHIFNPSEVTPYNIAYKYFSIITVFFGIITTPLWASFTEAWVKKDIDWIKNINKKLLKIWYITLLIGVIMLLFADNVYRFWIGSKVIIPFELTLAMFVFNLTYAFGSIYVIVLNGMGKIRIQFVAGIIAMILNIPLALFFAINLKLGVLGVILSTTVCNFNGYLLAPYQYTKIIENKASGSWIK